MEKSLIIQQKLQEFLALSSEEMQRIDNEESSGDLFNLIQAIFKDEDDNIEM